MDIKQKSPNTNSRSKSPLNMKKSPYATKNINKINLEKQSSGN
jgi:hypothetical protein